MNRSAPALAFAAFLAAPTAWAQVHWDVAAEGGALKRFVVSRPHGVPDAQIGPALELHGHVALLPFVRVGAYVEHDISAIHGDSTRQITTFGARAKLTPPWPVGAFHSWIFAGFGYGLAYGQSFHTTIPLTTGAPSDVAVAGAAGSFFDVPLGIGLGWRVRRPLEITAELATHFALGGFGSLYSGDRPASAAGQPPLLVDTPGKDLFAIGLLLGVGLEL